MLITIFAPTNVHLLEIAGVRDALFEANSKMQATWSPSSSRCSRTRGAWLNG